MSQQELRLVRLADQILSKANLNRVGQPIQKRPSEDLMRFAIKTPCGGQPGYKRK